MSLPWRVTLALLGAACASGAPNRPPAAPLPTPRPAMEPGGVEPRSEVVFRYPATGARIARYAFTRRDSIVATMPSGEEQVQVLGRIAYLTVTAIASDSGTKVTATVDSLVADSGMMLPAAVLDSARGTRWTALRLPAGGLSGVTGTRTSLLGDQVRDQLALLYPRLPADGARPGTHWTDSTEAPARVSAFEALETSLTVSEAGRPGPSGALPILVTASRSAKGEATQFGQTISLTATGSDTLTYQFASDGRVLAADGRRWTSLVVELSAIGQSVPAREISSLVMTILR